MSVTGVFSAKHAPVANNQTQPPLPPYLDPAVIEERLKQGRIAEYHEGSHVPSLAPNAAPPSYFRSYDQVAAAMKDLAERYPDLVELQDIGDSWEKTQGKADRDVLLLRLGNRKVTANKPSAMFLGGEHAREIANPELLMRFATQLLEGYGTDPEATALLDTRNIDLVPIMNPDGHATIERGYTKQPSGSVMHRKNTSTPKGTDLNRNYDFHWGGPGASSNPGSDTYRGPSAASEPEVQAVQRHVESTRPGIFIDWHSFSKLNLYPWGDTRDKAPHFDGLDALARKFSTYNHYTPQQSIKLYPTTGTSKDWVYGKFSIPAFTVETGDTFHQSDAEFGRSWAENAPVMTYAAKVADDPYNRVKGPEVVDVNVSAAGVGIPGLSPNAGRLTAQIAVSDDLTGFSASEQVIAGAEWVLDPFSEPGTGTPLAAADGAFDSGTETVVGAVPQSAPTANSQRNQLVYVRARNENGNWGPATAQWLSGTTGSN